MPIERDPMKRITLLRPLDQIGHPTIDDAIKAILANWKHQTGEQQDPPYSVYKGEHATLVEINRSPNELAVFRGLFKIAHMQFVNT
ncbi:MAG: hypothetical protein ACJ8C4_15600 [Gemmataceae bacterium]